MSDVPQTLIEAYLDGGLTVEAHRELSDWLRQSQANVDRFVAECRLHSELFEAFGGNERKAEEAYLPSPFGRGTVENLPSPFGRGAGGEGDEVDVGSQEPVPSTPCSVLRTPYSSLSSLLPTTPLGNVAFSYVMSAVLVGIGLFIFSLMPASSPRDAVVGNNPENSPNRTSPHVPTPEPELVSIARISGMVDCLWVDENEVPFHNKIKLHDKFALKSGLLEITYHTGARVILQGPCTYEVESPAGGYLSLGKLTARVEKKSGRVGEEERGRGEAKQQTSPRPSDGRGAGGEGSVDVEAQSALTLTLSQRARGPNTPSLPLSPSPPLFSVRTPTATVTDLGTEFGVEVNHNGKALVVVYVGEVMSQSTNPKDQDAESVHVKAGQSARIDGAKIVVEKLPPIGAGEASRFVRTFPRRVPCDPALMAHYSFEKQSGIDRSGNHNHLSLHGRPTFEPSGIKGLGDAIVFRGAQWADIDNAYKHPLGNSDYTWAAWVLFDEQPKTKEKQIFLAWGNSWDKTPRNGGVFVGVDGKSDHDKSRLRVNHISLANDWTTNYAPPIGRFVHLAGTHSNTTESLYVNGRLQDTHAGEPIDVFPGMIRLGAFLNPNSSDLNEYFVGKLADAQIYGRALDAREIAFLHEHPGVSLPVPVASDVEPRSEKKQVGERRSATSNQP